MSCSRCHGASENCVCRAKHAFQTQQEPTNEHLKENNFILRIKRWGKKNKQRRHYPHPPNLCDPYPDFRHERKPQKDSFILSVIEATHQS